MNENIKIKKLVQDDEKTKEYIKKRLDLLFSKLYDIDCEDAVEYVNWLLTKTNMRKYPKIFKSYPVFKKGVYWIDFGRNIGSEQEKERPAVILWGTQKSEVIIVVPISDEDKYKNSTFWFHVPLSTGDTALVEQIRVVSKTRINRPFKDENGRVRSLLNDELKNINNAIDKLKFNNINN